MGTITQNDLEILKSEIMADTTDGGGLPTGIAVIDGVSNNLFPDVSDIDRLIGRVRLRKVSLAVKTANAELLQAVRMLFTELPENPNISVFAFKPSSFADRRADAQNSIESYLTLGIRAAGHLLETQLKGQRVIQLSLDNSDDVPKAGSPLVLVQNEGQVDEFYQYIKPIKVSTARRSFQLDFDKRVTRIVAAIEFGEALRYSFSGLTVPEFYSNAPTLRRAVLREAQVSDAAKYYSASRLAQPVVAMQSRQVKLESIFTQIVPSSLTETALPLLDPVGQSKALIKATDGTVAINQSISVNPSTAWQVGSSIYPSSINIAVSGVTMTDADGELRDVSGVIYGSVDYSAGRITWYDTANFGIKTVTGSFTPAGSTMRVMQSELIYTPEVDVGSSYIRELQAKPARGSMQASFQVGGQATIIRDNAKGALVDNDGKSYGILDYENKIVQLVLPAIPDAESAIVFTYSTDLGTTNVGGQSVKGCFDFTAQGYIPANSIITWGSKSATISNGVITGDATGTFDGFYLRIKPNQLPAPNTTFSIGYSTPTDTTEINMGRGDATATSGNQFAFNVGAIDAGKIKGFVNITSGEWVTADGTAELTEFHMSFSDDGLGNIVKTSLNNATKIGAATKDLNVTLSGTVNYATGAVVIMVNASANLYDIVSTISKDPRYKYFKYIDAKVISYSEKLTPATASVTAIHYEYSGTNNVTGTETTTLEWSANSLTLELPKSADAPILPSSVFIDGAHDNNGLMVRNGVTVGSVDYANGVVELTAWLAGANSIKIDGAIRELAVPPVSSIVFRTASAPIKNGTFSINLTVDGVPYQLTAENDGTFGSGISYTDGKLDRGVTGFIEYKTGVVALYGNNIDPESVTYTGMAYSYLPLDSSLIGLDPVRLPSDGRVPFVRKGDSIAITELKTMQLATNAASNTFNLGFERLSDVNVVDITGKKVSFDYLDIDLDAGTLKLNSSFVMTGLTAPLTAKYRIMDIALVIETDISGRVTLSTPITHDYSTAAVFSSMLLAGDMQARAFNVFSQESWTSIFSDSLIGDAATSQLQVTNNPIVITNRDAIEERWALIFTGSTSFRIVGQTVGEIGVGSINGATSPLNPMTGQPYFTIPQAAWGTGWSANNLVRFNTAAAKYPVWIGNAIQQHQGSSSDNYDFTIAYHANIDRDRV